MITSYKSRLLELLTRDAFAKREVTLSSGKKSNFYIDCRRVVLTAEGHFLVGWLLNNLLGQNYPEVEGIGGMSMGADPLASATSLISFLGGRPLNAFYVRKEAKAHGTAQFVEGHQAFKTGARVAIVEDVVTTGASALAAVERAQAVGLMPVCVLSLVDRQEGGREVIEKHLPLNALFSRSDFPA